MATSIREELKSLAPAHDPSQARMVRRRISPQAGHALEILGHAIDYLADEYVHHGGTFCVRDPQVRAIQTLMACNRQIYFECPVVPTLKERCLALLHLRAA